MSPKFFSLLKFMIDQRVQQEQGSEVARVIIFEEKRIIVEVMWKYICYLMSSEGVEECSFMRAGYVLGGSTGGRIEDEDLNALEEVKKKQDQTLQDFRCGKLNILIATSVVEEGLDIPACNTVIRYCFPQTYRAFVQSRGRARAKPARFVFFIDTSEIEPRRDEIRNYGKIEEFLKEYANSERTEEDESEDDDDEEEKIPSLYVEVTGAKLTSDMAIQHLNFYCDQLPKDGYTSTMPKEDTINTNSGFVTTLTMPKLCPIRQVTGQPMQNRKNAKKSAAMEALTQLYHAKEFDTHLVPHFRQSENNTLLFEKQGERSLLLDQKIKIPSVFWRKDMLKSQSVTKSERVVVNEYHLYAIEMFLTPKVDKFEEYFSSSPYHKVCCYGIVSPSLLPELPLFDVYPRYGVVEVKIRYIKTMKVPSPQVISNIQWFHNTIFTKILAIEKVKFLEQLLFKNYLIVPLSVKSAKAKLGCNFGVKGTGSTPSTEAELDIAHSFITQLRARWNEQKNCWIFGNMPQSADKCKDCVLFQHYRYPPDTDNSNLANAFFVVIGISEYTANSVMEHGKNQHSYGVHHEEKYAVQLEHWEEPLLKSRHLSKRYNMLSDKGKKQEAGEYASTRSTLHLIREVHQVHPFPASLWNQATCLPSILWRMETLCLAGELYSKLLPGVPSLSEGVTGHLRNYISLPCCDLITKLDRGNEAECDINYVGMIQCLTTSKCQEPFNLERLEFLGDSFLKFIFAVYFYRTMPEKHEGWLSKFRSEVTSNANLRRRSIESIDLPRYVFNKACLPNNNWLPPNYLPELTYEKLLEKIGERFSTEGELVNLSEVDIEQAISELTEDELIPVLNAHLPDCYLQDMGDKVIPDSMEALIGLFVSQGGYLAAVNLLDTIGLGIVPGLEENESLLCDVLYQPTPPPQVISTTAKHRDLTTAAQFVQLQERIGYKFRNPLYLLEALTHATYSDITACYQRLEFLGDAILDELMVCHIFENNTELGPGKLSDLKSNLVCNTTLSKVSMRYGFHTHILYDSPELYLTLNRFYKNFQDRPLDLEHWYTSNFDLTDVVYDGTEEEKHQELDLDHQVVQVPKILGDVVESVIGAIYLDSGEDMQVVWGVIWPWFQPFYDAYKDTIPKQPKAEVHELYPAPRVQISAPIEITNHKSRITVTIVTTSGERYSFPTIGRDKMSVTNVCFDRALKFHQQHLAVN